MDGLLFGLVFLLGYQTTQDLDHRCISQPPEPIICDKDTTNCMTVKEYSPNGTLASMTRTCSPIGLGNIEECDDGTTADGRPARICHRSCKKDGCNVGQTLHGLGRNVICFLSVLLLLVRVA